MTERRFRVAPGVLDAERVELTGDEARHVRVMRLDVGDAVGLFDGVGGAARGVLEAVSADRVSVRVVAREATAAEAPVSVTLVQAVPVKFQRLDTTARLCTELGVARIVPVVSAHTQVPPGGVRIIGKRAERWRRIVEAAAKQSGRAVVPPIDEPVAFADLPWDQLPTARFLLTLTATVSLREALAQAPASDCAVLVGPEGGWTAAEEAAAADYGCVAVALGPRVLRADSAAPVALSLVQSAWGDLR